MEFWTCGLRKMGLDKFLKSSVSQDLSTNSMINRTKPCLNLEDSTFTKFLDHCEGNSVGKSLSEWYAQSEDCLLIYWLPITSILFLLDTVYSNIFRCNYLRNEKYFLTFFSIFEFKIQFLTFSKTWIDKCLESPVSGNPWTSYIVIGRNTVQSWTIARLPYFLIPAKVIQVEKVSQIFM